MIIEMHCHTSEHSSCSHVRAADMVHRAIEVGLQALVITDHHYLWTSEELQKLRQEAGVPEIFYIFAGQEVDSEDFGHILVYGADESIPPGGKVEDIRRQWPDSAIIWAHPYRKGYEPPDKRLQNPAFAAIEIFSSNYSVSESMKALQAWHRLKFTAVSGTDTHAVSYTGSYPTIFDHPVDSLEKLIQEMKAGRCRPYFKERPRSGTTNTQIMELTVGPKASEKRQEMVVKTYETSKAWQEAERTHEVTEKIMANGFDSGQFRIPRSLGGDEKDLSLVEERVEGKDLYHMLVSAQPDTAGEYLKLTARWLSKLHNLGLKITPESEFLAIEPERLDYYLKDMVAEKHRHLSRAQEVRDRVLASEQHLIQGRPELLVQCHGDFHLKNIFIGQDETNTPYVSVIDFGSSFQQPQAFDVGTFIAQYRNMFFDHQNVARKAPVDLFLEEYMQTAKNLPPDFMAQVNLFVARTCLSILYYLVKVGKADSENFWSILVEAEKNLASREFLST